MKFLKNKSGVITYTIDKNINNSLYISVQNGEVVVQAPWYFSRNQIQEAVEEKRRWILDKIKEYELKKEEYINNSIKILGQDCMIKIKYQNIKSPNISVGKSLIQIELPNKYRNVNKKDLLQALVEKIYNVVAEREIESAMEKARFLLGYAPEDYRFERMNNVLAKCSQDKTITINPDIVKYKTEIIDYVVLHEFAHLKYKTHSKKFYEIIKKYEPNYEKYALQINGLQY